MSMADIAQVIKYEKATGKHLTSCILVIASEAKQSSQPE
jgi:hypothetical protein